MSFHDLPIELCTKIMRDLASQGNLKSLSSLSETCWSLYHAGNPILYECNIEHQECSGFKWAVSNDQVNTLKKFLQYGVPVNYLLRYREDQRDELVSPLWLAARHGSIEVVRHFFTLPDVDWNWATEDFHDTPLHIAIESGHTELALLLLSHQEVLVNAEDGAGWTPFIYAVSEGDEALIKHLLSINSVDPDHRTRTGKSALFIAADWGRSTDVVKLLLDTGRVDVNFVSLEPVDTPLTAAKRPDVVKLLVEHPDIDVNFTPAGSAAPITIAAEEGRLEIVKILLTHPDIDPDGSEYPPEAPILRAAEEGHEEVVSVLLADDRVGQETRRLLAKRYPQFL
ncbi:ANK_REP_REGION domain-containing protein [Trichoderma simmonsii]|uniref:ANK_REP_REGION domain-containing protein n=1 Tax=Trichoderma simmonsii TaxID=1491479 RepID=A0A8G0L1W8_9HYPO|nr:ANK_REP_REGION domain-containing protein [Trichoderma simmonsii]